MDCSFVGVDFDRGVPSWWPAGGRTQRTQDLPYRHRGCDLDVREIRVLASAGELSRDRRPLRVQCLAVQVGTGQATAATWVYQRADDTEPVPHTNRQVRHALLHEEANEFGSGDDRVREDHQFRLSVAARLAGFGRRIDPVDGCCGRGAARQADVGIEVATPRVLLGDGAAGVDMDLPDTGCCEECRDRDRQSAVTVQDDATVRPLVEGLPVPRPGPKGPKSDFAGDPALPGPCLDDEPQTGQFGQQLAQLFAVFASGETDEFLAPENSVEPMQGGHQVGWQATRDHAVPWIETDLYLARTPVEEVQPWPQPRSFGQMDSLFGGDVIVHDDSVTRYRLL